MVEHEMAPNKAFSVDKQLMIAIRNVTDNVEPLRR